MAPTVKETVKKATDVVKDAVRGKEDNSPITNDPMDNNPPGSSSIRDRGVLNRASIENRQGGTTPTPGSKVSDSIETPDPDSVTIIQPYVAPKPLKAARAEARAARKFDNLQDKHRARSAGAAQKDLSPRAIAALVRVSSGLDQGTANELEALLGENAHPDTIREIKELAKTSSLFAGDQKPGNLQELGVLPGAQKPPEFDAAPGTNQHPDPRYYPYRFASHPKEEDYEDGDISYSVLEDGTFTVLSAEQQTPSWQASHHLPRMTMIERFGGEEAPKSLFEETDLVEKTETEQKAASKDGTKN